MTNIDDTKLKNYESEDIIDVIIKLEKSFNIRFSKTAFAEVRTFGDLCDIVEAHINYDHTDDCTKQQAFYRIRKAIADTQRIDVKKSTSAATWLTYFHAIIEDIKRKSFRIGWELR